MSLTMSIPFHSIHLSVFREICFAHFSFSNDPHLLLCVCVCLCVVCLCGCESVFILHNQMLSINLNSEKNHTFTAKFSESPFFAFLILTFIFKVKLVIIYLIYEYIVKGDRQCTYY